LIETLQNHPSLTPSVIFLLTAHDSTGVREIAQRLNVQEVIAKPAHPEQICDLVSRTINELRGSGIQNNEPGIARNAAKVSLTQPGFQDMNISHLLWEVAKKFQPQADIKGQLLVVGKTEPNSTVRTNGMQLRQAVQTLVWNAINNTPTGGTVTLSSENISNMVRILFRGTSYYSHGGIDYGLNEQDLSTVKSIAKQLGGDVTVESEPGKGTCFTLSLPISNLN
jgi:signal transduction histidine kinase